MFGNFFVSQKNTIFANLKIVLQFQISNFKFQNSNFKFIINENIK